MGEEASEGKPGKAAGDLINSSCQKGKMEGSAVGTMF